MWPDARRSREALDGHVQGEQSEQDGAAGVMLPTRALRGPVWKGQVDRILNAALIRGGWAMQAGPLPTTPYLLRRVKRLTWFALVACVALMATRNVRPDVSEEVSTRLALIVILVASWAIVVHVTLYLRTEETRRAAASEAARLEGARLTASAMQDRIANKLSLTVGYAEFLVTDPRLPEDLREQAQKAMDGARAAAEQMSQLKRLTRQDYEARLNCSGAAPESPGGYDSDRLEWVIGPGARGGAS
jgi:hypothetical protein